ncbi:MAG: HAMP domain-containing protein [Candidatus Riflebacteria bacterium]|nr:HAMP domain-containing protein [Candidatus Riflebacteria bacterium]
MITYLHGKFIPGFPDSYFLTDMTSFRARILLTFLLIFLAMIGISSIWHYQTIRRFTLDGFESDARIMTKQVAKRAVAGIFTEDPGQLGDIASDVFLIPNVCDLYFYNENKKLLGHYSTFSHSQEKTVEGLLGPVPVFSLSEDHAIVVVPVILEGLEPEKDEKKVEVIGWTVCNFNLLGVHHQLDSVIWSFLLSAIIITQAFGFFIVFLERWVNKPLIQLIEKVKSIAGGDLSVRVDFRETHDEIGALGKHINLMADSLQNYTTDLEALVHEKIGKIEVRERQLMFQEKMASLGRMSASIAHEINNPLNYMALGMDYLELREEKMRNSGGKSLAEDFPERKKVFSDIRHGFSRLKGILDSLRKFSRKDETQTQDYFFQEVFLDTHRIFEHELRCNAVKLEMKSASTRQLHGSMVRLQQILLNLLRNSLDAFEENHTSSPVIRIEVSELIDKTIIHFEDNGPGISPEHRKRIFEPFFTTKPPGKGTGIGLALCFELAAREGGVISLGESAIGGAAFDVILPLKSQLTG